MTEQDYRRNYRLMLITSILLLCVGIIFKEAFISVLGFAVLIFSFFEKRSIDKAFNKQHPG